MNSLEFVDESFRMLEEDKQLKSYFDKMIANHPWESLIPNFEKAVSERKLSLEKVIRMSILLGVFVEMKRRGV